MVHKGSRVPTKADTVSDSPRKNRRKQESMSLFIAAGIDAINTSGVDHISVSQIAQLAKSSRPTFYAYFGDISGLLAEMWISHGTEFLYSLSDPGFRFEVATSQEKMKLRALLEIFTVSHRILEVQEVVEPTTSKWWTVNGGQTEYSKLKLAWFAANRIGSWLTQPIEPKALMSGIVEQVIALLSEKPSGIPADPRFASDPNISDPEVDDNSMVGQLMKATIKVIAKSGVTAASMTRIARNIQVTTGSIYPRFHSFNEILYKAFDFAITQVTEQNFNYSEKTGFAPDQFGAVVKAGLGANRKTWRDFRVETHLEARVNTELAAQMRGDLEKTNKRVMTGLGALPISSGERESIAFLIHTIGIGMAVLMNAGIPANEIDHRVITREMIAAMANRA